MNYHYRSSRSANKVKRYHTIDLIVPETVGHHCANVALLCAHIAGNPSAELLLAALTHDYAEQFTGDIPATAKWAYPALESVLGQIEAEVDQYNLKLTETEKFILKQADMLDLCFKCVEELKMGNTTVKPILERGINWIRSRTVHINTVVLLEDLLRDLS